MLLLLFPWNVLSKILKTNKCTLFNRVPKENTAWNQQEKHHFNSFLVNANASPRSIHLKSNCAAHCDLIIHITIDKRKKGKMQQSPTTTYNNNNKSERRPINYELGVSDTSEVERLFTKSFSDAYILKHLAYSNTEWLPLRILDIYPWGP